MSATPPDRRDASRVPGGPSKAGVLLSSIQDDCVDVDIRNVCSTGIGLLLDKSVDTTQVQAVILYGKAQTFSVRISIHAVYCVDSKDGRYILGAKFARELTDDELQQLTGP
jgi:hypothetical protein